MRTDRRTDMTMLTVAFRNFANALKFRKFPCLRREGMELRVIIRYIDYVTGWATINCDPMLSRTKRIFSPQERHDLLWGHLSHINYELGGLFLLARSVGGLNLNTHLHPLFRLIMCGAMPPLRHRLQGV
jgi:hypothetical protein